MLQCKCERSLFRDTDFYPNVHGGRWGWLSSQHRFSWRYKTETRSGMVQQLERRDMERKC